MSYAKLVVLSVGLQDGLRQGLRHDNPFSDQVRLGHACMCACVRA